MIVLHQSALAANEIRSRNPPNLRHREEGEIIILMK